MTKGNKGKYRIMVDDNYAYMDESARYFGGTAQTLEEAIAKCKRIVEASLEDCYKPGMSADQLGGCYRMFGEDPFILTGEPGEVPFSAWTYAKEISAQVVARLERAAATEGGAEDGEAGSDGSAGNSDAGEGEDAGQENGRDEPQDDVPDESEGAPDDPPPEDPPADDPDPPSEPVRRSSRHFNYYDDEWKTEILECWKCGWKGTFEEGNDEVYEALMDSSCPNCDWLEAPILAIVSFPTMQDAITNWDKLPAEERETWLKRAEFERRLEEEELKSPDQLPEIDGDLIELAWDFVGGLDDSVTVIRHKGREIWREPLVFEGYFRFKEVLDILEAKYGERLVDLVPAEGTTLFLHGDNIRSLGWVREWREELRARSKKRREPDRF